MRIVAFDLGSNMAMAFADTVTKRELFVISRTFKGDRVTRAAATLQWLCKTQVIDADFVIYERPFARGQHATRSLWGLAGLIEATYGAICPVVDITPADIKKWATGNAKADKDEMIATAQVYGYSGSNEHEADAFLLLHYAIANHTEEK